MTCILPKMCIRDSAYVEEVAAFCRARGVCHGLIIPEEPFEDQLIRALSAAGLVA